MWEVNPHRAHMNTITKTAMMKSFGTLLLLLLILGCGNRQKPEKKPLPPEELENLVSFAKSFGAIRYFHPSDQASELDWEKFAIYGSKYVREHTSKDSIVAILDHLYKDVAPTVSFHEEEPILSIENHNDTCPRTYWQHQGLGINSEEPAKVYYSLRINALSSESKGAKLGTIMRKLDAKEYIGKLLRFSAKVRMNAGSPGTGQLRLHIKDKEGVSLYFNGMSRNPISTGDVTEYKIETVVDTSAADISYGFSLKGKGAFVIEDYSLNVVQDSESKEEKIIALKDELGNEMAWDKDGSGYDLIKAGKSIPEKSLVIMFKDSLIQKIHKNIFEEIPEPGEKIIRKLGDKTYLNMPVSLCLNDDNLTKPFLDNTFQNFKKKVENTGMDENTLDFRIGNVVLVYNVVEHFFPYLKEISIDWDNELRKALEKSYRDSDLQEHIETLEQMVAAIKDGHALIEGYEKERGMLPIAWEVVENQLVITNIIKEDLTFKIGDIISEINGENPNIFLDRFRSRISAGTEGWLNRRLKEESIIGKMGDTIRITVDGTSHKLVYTDTFYNDGRRKNNYRPSFIDISDDTKYVHLGMNNMEAFTTLIPQLKKADNLIFDLRAYPYITPEIISHLLKTNDTASNWMKIPLNIYPNQDRTGYLGAGWQLKPIEPYLGDKNIVFLTNGEAISASESLLGYVKAYKLGTIIGQPTAGANGNYNLTNLLGGLKFKWTGMHLVQPDGVVVFTKGIQPDIEVNETVEGIKANDDEILGYAIKFLMDKSK
tara:strand:+ start:18336 stop:20642 length:2307 start_codon:yes stop_codon:yes gene_type:complete